MQETGGRDVAKGDLGRTKAGESLRRARWQRAGTILAAAAANNGGGREN